MQEGRKEERKEGREEGRKGGREVERKGAYMHAAVCYCKMKHATDSLLDWFLLSFSFLLF